MLNLCLNMEARFPSCMLFSSSSLIVNYHNGISLIWDSISNAIPVFRGVSTFFPTTGYQDKVCGFLFHRSICHCNLKQLVYQLQVRLILSRQQPAHAYQIFIIPFSKSIPRRIVQSLFVFLIFNALRISLTMSTLNAMKSEFQILLLLLELIGQQSLVESQPTSFDFFLFSKQHMAPKQHIAL